MFCATARSSGNMVYVMADIHGQYQAFLQMLEQIGFTHRDTLYVIGDVIDRGPDGIPLLLDIMERGNVVMLRGNHEQFMLDYYRQCSVGKAHWLMRLGGGPTLSAFGRLKPEKRESVLSFLEQTPLQLQVEVEGYRYYLVHGMYTPDGKPDTLLWGRYAGRSRTTLHPNGVCYVGWPVSDGFVVFGHTPTAEYMPGTPLRIFFGDGVIGIDCGCAYAEYPGRLGCLRLNDWRQFYVEI